MLGNKKKGMIFAEAFGTMDEVWSTATIRARQGITEHGNNESEDRQINIDETCNSIRVAKDEC